MIALRTNLSLIRDCSWDDVRHYVRDRKNAIAICPIAVDNTQELTKASALLRDKPNDIKCITALISCSETIKD